MVAVLNSHYLGCFWSFYYFLHKILDLLNLQVYKNCYQNEEHGDFEDFTEITRIGGKWFHKHISKKDWTTHSGFPEQRLILYNQKYSIEFKNNMLLKSQLLPSKDLQFVYID